MTFNDGKAIMVSDPYADTDQPCFIIERFEEYIFRPDFGINIIWNSKVFETNFEWLSKPGYEAHYDGAIIKTPDPNSEDSLLDFFKKLPADIRTLRVLYIFLSLAQSYQKAQKPERVRVYEDLGFSLKNIFDQDMTDPGNTIDPADLSVENSQIIQLLKERLYYQLSFKLRCAGYISGEQSNEFAEFVLAPNS